MGTPHFPGAVGAPSSLGAAMIVVSTMISVEHPNIGNAVFRIGVALMLAANFFSIWWAVE